MWDLIVSVPDHCLSFYFMKIDPISLASSLLNILCNTIGKEKLI